MEVFNSNEWLIMDNALIGDINNFGLSIMMGFTKSDDIDEQEENNRLSFLLTVYDKTDRRKTECVFLSLEDTISFINNYVTICNSIVDVSANYMNYCISEHTINKGYSS